MKNLYYLLMELQITLTFARGANEKEQLSPLSVPNLSIGQAYQQTQSLCRKSIIKLTLKELDDNETIRSWVAEGVNLHKDKKVCLFCHSELKADRLQELEGYFNTAYEQLFSDIGKKQTNLKAAADTIKSFSSYDSSRLYNELKQEYETAQKTLDKAKEKVLEKYRELYQYLISKKSSLTKEITLSPQTGFTSAEMDFSAAIQNINAIIAKHNDIYENYEKSVKAAKDKLIWHYSAEVYAEYKTHRDMAEDRAKRKGFIQIYLAKLEKTKQRLQQRISNHNISAERISVMLQDFLGRSDIKLETAERDYRISRNRQEAHNLSEGEKMAVAFCYFIAKLEEKDFTRKDSVIVIDDPISSLDTNSLYAAASFIRRYVEGSNQLFILTHNYYFFQEIYNWMATINIPKNSNIKKNFYLLKASSAVNGPKRSSVLSNLDKSLKFQDSEYIFLFKQLYQARKQCENETLIIPERTLLPNIARRVLETFLRFKFPDMANSAVTNIYNTGLKHSKGFSKDELLAYWIGY